MGVKRGVFLRKSKGQCPEPCKPNKSDCVLRQQCTRRNSPCLSNNQYVKGRACPGSRLPISTRVTDTNTVQLGGESPRAYNALPSNTLFYVSKTKTMYVCRGDASCPLLVDRVYTRTRSVFSVQTQHTGPSCYSTEK